VKPIIRVAQRADLPAVRSGIGTHFDLFTLWPGSVDFLEAELAFGTIIVGEVGGAIAGFGGTLRRGRLTHLGDLFVLPAHQSSGLGRAILTRLLPPDAPKITFASRDHRALALYIRNGMRPACPLFYLYGPPGRPAGRAGAAWRWEGGLPEAAALDARVSGGARPECLAWYAGLPGVTARAGGSGYAFTRELGDTVVVGPAGGETPEDSVRAVLDAVAAHPHARLIKIVVPGVHPLLPALVEAGWRIGDVDTIMVSDGAGVPLDRYVPHPDLG